MSKGHKSSLIDGENMTIVRSEDPILLCVCFMDEGAILLEERAARGLTRDYALVLV